MMNIISSLVLSVCFAVLAQAHFVLQAPPSLGFNDVNEAASPCGSFDITSRNGASDYPVGGIPIHVLSTHTRSIFQYRAALLNNTESFVNLIPQVNQQGVGDYCLPTVPGIPEWIGLDAVVQVVQFGPDGVLFQCAAVKFTEGNAIVAGSDCKNSSGVQAVFTTATNTLPGQTTLAPASTSGVKGGNGSVATTTGGSNPTTSTPGTAATSSGAAVVLNLKEASGFWGMVMPIVGVWLL